MLPSIPNPADYDVSTTTAFLPEQPPLPVLPHAYYQPWERISQNLQGLILSGRLRSVIDRMPILSTDLLATDAEWRRAYSLLSFLVHAYIWGGNRPAEVVPPPLSVPFLTTCRHFELPPVATYAAVGLWNFKPLFDDEPADHLDNLSTLTTFTGSLDESWFYLISVAIEAQGAPTVPIMLDAIQAARQGDAARVAICLQLFAERLDQLSSILSRMYEHCDPHVFYHRIRPFLAGSKNMSDAGLPNGVVFDDGTGCMEPVQFSGGSNAQSSLIQFFDLVLGIEHLPTGVCKSSRATDADAPGQGPPAPSHNFIQDMRRYMPGPHRRFLEHVASVANIREFVEARKGNRALAIAYDACLAMLRDFRDRHIQIVSRYIIIKSRESREQRRSLSPQLAPQRVNLAAAGSKGSQSPESRRRNLRGTGGTALIPFLKQAREETGEPAIGNWARRVLSNGPPLGAFASLGSVGEHANGDIETVGLAGIWSLDDAEGGICHW